MPTHGKKFWGNGGVSFDAVERVEALLEERTGMRAREVYADYSSRSYERVLVIDGVEVTFAYNSSWPGYGTVRWKGECEAAQEAVDEVRASL